MRMLTANRLHDGFVVYWTADGRWSERLEDGALVDGPEAAALLAARQRAAAAGDVVGPYLIPVELAEGGPRPLGQRERLRTLGPSVRPDLGYQAGGR